MHTHKAKSKRAIIYTSFQLHLNIFERSALFKGKLTARTDTGYYTIENIWDPSVSLASSFRNDIWMARRGGRKKEGRRGEGRNSLCLNWACTCTAQHPFSLKIMCIIKSSYCCIKGGKRVKGIYQNFRGMSLWQLAQVVSNVLPAGAERWRCSMLPRQTLCFEATLRLRKRFYTDTHKSKFPFHSLCSPRPLATPSPSTH